MTDNLTAQDIFIGVPTIGGPSLSIRGNYDSIADWQLALVDLATGAEHPIATVDILSFTGEILPGATKHRLGQAVLELAMGTEDNPSQSAQILEWEAWQLLRVIPQQDTSKELWGVVLKQEAKYGNRPGNDTARLLVSGIEKLLHARIVESAGAPIASSGVTADDYAKDLVTACFTGTDPDGNSRVWPWGTLTVEADASAAGATDASREDHGQHLDEVIADLATAYSFAYGLDVALAAGAFTFTFETAYPAYTDKISGASRVVINDLGNTILTAERHTDRSFFANAAYEKETSHAEINADSITANKRWETKTEFSKIENVETALLNADVRVGTVWAIDQTSRGASVWLDRWNVGDRVLRNNNRLGLTESNERIEAVLFEFSPRTDKRLALQVRWGDDKALITERMTQRSPAGGRGGGRPKTPWATIATDVAASSASGTADEYARGNHAHKFRLAVGAEEATPSSGVITFVAGSGQSITKTGDHQLTFAVASPFAAHDIVGVMHTVTASALQLVGATGANTLGLITPTTTGAVSSIVATDASGYTRLTRLEIASAADYISIGTTYLYVTAAVRLLLVAGTRLAVSAGGQWTMDIDANAVKPGGDGAALGATAAASRWNGLFVKNDVNISTGVGIIHADGVTAGQLLVANGTRYVPGTGANITAPGSTTQVIFNDGGVFGASSKLTFNKTTGVLTIS